jgi:hypothetical protein
MTPIDKDKIVAEIEKRINETESMRSMVDPFWEGQISAFDSVLKILDTIEPEEVDLKKEIYDAEKRFGDIDEMGGYRILIFDDEFRDILRHFFELGMQKSKGE